MHRVLTAAEMREADRATIVERGVPGLILMESAARAVADRLAQTFPDLDRQRVLVLCGKGNNGGDGLSLARQLLLRHPDLDLRVVLLAQPAALSPDAAANWRALTALDAVPTVITSREEWSRLLPGVGRSTVLVDAILGTGLRGPARGLSRTVISDLRARLPRAAVVAVDMPSGLGSDSGELLGECLPAGTTVTFTAPKVSQVLAPSCEMAGDLEIARIGTSDAVLDGLPGPRLLLAEPSDTHAFIASRDRAGHKGTYGHVVAIGGSRSKPGAILMAGTAALRAGAGLATVVTAAGSSQTVIAATPELMVDPAQEETDGTIGPSAFDERWFEGRTVAVVGPGLGRAPHNRALARRIHDRCPLPMVIDADGLAALEGRALPRRSAPTVLTPHPGEMGRLIGSDARYVQEHRVEVAREFSARTGTHVVLKGYRTLVAAPGGDVVVNPTGTPGMGTAGSGDILTGIIAGLLAQFPRAPVLQTVVAAVYLHGLAGELAARSLGEQGMLATDIGRHLGKAAEGLRR